MNNLTLLVVLFALIAIALGTITIWSRRQLVMRSVALALTVLMLPLGWFALDDLLSRPKQRTADELRAPGMCNAVLHAEIKERVGVYLFLVDKKLKGAEPRYIFVPWDLKFAQRLQRSKLHKQAAQGKGTILIGDRACQQKGKGEGKEGEGKDGDAKKKQPRRPGSSGEEEGPDDGSVHFHPDPVAPIPEKDLTPFYEAPSVIQMPQNAPSPAVPLVPLN